MKPGEKESQFEETAREVVVPEPPTPEPSGPEPKLVPELLPPASDVFTIEPETARACVKLCFAPMVKWGSPDWALTDDEAQRATPEMLAFMRWLLDSYCPQFLIAAAKDRGPLADLVLAMIGLLWFKWKLVQLLREQRALSEPEPASTPAAAAEGDFSCDDCGEPFPSRFALARHECKGRKE